MTVYDDTTPEQLLERIEGADIIVTKEMPVNGDLIRKFPASVKLICEAGTGYNNLDLDAAREKGSPSANIPAYSSDARSPHGGHDDLKFKLHHAGPDENAGKRKPMITLRKISRFRTLR